MRRGGRTRPSPRGRGRKMARGGRAKGRRFQQGGQVQDSHVKHRRHNNPTGKRQG